VPAAFHDRYFSTRTPDPVTAVYAIDPDKPDADVDFEAEPFEGD
jgi:hypothetical protein